jgi:hypothetical protein
VPAELVAVLVDGQVAAVERIVRAVEDVPLEDGCDKGSDLRRLVDGRGAKSGGSRSIATAFCAERTRIRRGWSSGSDSSISSSKYALWAASFG